MYKSPTYSQLVAELENARKELKKLKTKRAKALSEYDIRIAYSGDKKLAVRASTELVCNHIRYFENELRKMSEQLKLV